MRFASYELAIEAPAEVVWRLLTTGDGLVRWVGPEAAADPVPGGDLRWVHPNGATVMGHFVEVDPHRRLVFTYGWDPAAVEDHERGWGYFLGLLRDAANSS